MLTTNWNINDAKHDLRKKSSTYMKNVDTDTFDKHKEYANGNNLSETLVKSRIDYNYGWLNRMQLVLSF